MPKITYIGSPAGLMIFLSKLMLEGNDNVTEKTKK